MAEQHDQAPIRRRRRKRQQHGWRSVALAGLVLAVATSGAAIGSTFAANFSAQTGYDTSQFQAASVTAPTGLTATSKGKSVTLAWTHATTSVKTKQVVAIDDQKTKSTCSSSTPSPYTAFASVGSSLSTTASSYTDSARSTSGTYQAGDWLCYRVSSTFNTSWTSSAYASTRAGFVATALALTGKTNKITNSAKVVITFNQKLSAKPSTTGAVVSATTTKTHALLLGDTNAGPTSATTNTVNLGTLVSSVALVHTGKFTTLTYTLSTTTKKLTLVFKGGPATKPTFTGTPKWTFIPYATLKYKTTTGVKVCTTNTHLATLCRPHVTTKKF